LGVKCAIMNLMVKIIIRGMLKVYYPKTHYVINSVSVERIDMESRRLAKKFIRQRLSNREFVEEKTLKSVNKREFY
jgi:hypothetical protein